jgi:hypothetical protein
MTANLFEAEKRSPPLKKHGSTRNPALSAEQLASHLGRDTGSLSKRRRRFLPVVLVRRDLAIPKRILLTSASIWRMADRRGGAGISPGPVLYLDLLEVRITGSFGQLEAGSRRMFLSPYMLNLSI